jgi:hypothetical protein
MLAEADRPLVQGPPGTRAKLASGRDFEISTRTMAATPASAPVAAANGVTRYRSAPGTAPPRPGSWVLSRVPTGRPWVIAHIEEQRQGRTLGHASLAQGQDARRAGRLARRRRCRHGAPAGLGAGVAAGPADVDGVAAGAGVAAGGAASTQPPSIQVTRPASLSSLRIMTVSLDR